MPSSLMTISASPSRSTGTSTVISSSRLISRKSTWLTLWWIGSRCSSFTMLSWRCPSITRLMSALSPASVVNAWRSGFQSTLTATGSDPWP